MAIKQKLCSNSEAFPLLFQKWREGYLFIIIQYGFQMFLLCLANWFPQEVKAHFLLQGSVGAEHEILLPGLLCQPCDIKPHRCRTQPPVFTSNSLHSWVAAEEFTDGWPGWQGVGEMTQAMLMQDNMETWMKQCWGREMGEGEGSKWLYLNIMSARAWQAIKGIWQGGNQDQP